MQASQIKCHQIENQLARERLEAIWKGEKGFYLALKKCPEKVPGNREEHSTAGAVTEKTLLVSYLALKGGGEDGEEVNAGGWHGLYDLKTGEQFKQLWVPAGEQL